MDAKEKKLLEWVRRTGGLLESQVVASGLSRSLNKLLAQGLVDMSPHPTVKDRSGFPASAVVPMRTGSSGEPPVATMNCLPPEFGDVDALQNSKAWLISAIRASGGEVTGSGMGFGQVDVFIKIDGFPFVVTMRPSPSDAQE